MLNTRKSAGLFVILNLLFSPAFAATNDELDAQVSTAATGSAEEQAKKCEDALASAQESLQRMSDNRAIIAPANVNGQNPQAQPQSPVAEAINKIAEGQAKLAEAEQQRIQKLQELGDNQLKELMGYSNKLQDLRQENAKTCIEIVDVETNKAKADLTVRRGCQDYADKKFEELYGASAAKASRSQLKISKGGKLKGRRRSMYAMKAYYLRECMCKPQTQEAFAMNMTEMNAKSRQFAIKQQMILSDREHLEDQIPAVNANYETKRGNIETGTAIARNAIAQSNMLQTIGLIAAVSTASSDAEEGGKIAGTTASAMQTLENMGSISAICQETVESNKKGIYVPADVYPLFTSVNRACRPDQSASRFCVQNSGQQSVDMQNRTGQ